MNSNFVNIDKHKIQENKMSELQNINDITKGAMAVIISQVLPVLPKNEEGLTVSQTAKMLNISISKLALLRKNTRGHICYIEDGKVLYLPSRVRAALLKKKR